MNKLIRVVVAIATTAGVFSGFAASNGAQTISEFKYAEVSGNDSANRNESGWYVGVKITWNAKTRKATDTTVEVTDNINSHNVSAFKVYPSILTWNNSVVGSGISGLGGSVSGITMYLTTLTWYAHIVPEDALTLQGADYTATLKVSHPDQGDEYFKITIPYSDYSEALRDSPLTSLTNAVVTLRAESFNYDFTEQTNAVVSVVLGGRALVEGVQYEIDPSSGFFGTGNGKTNDFYSVTVNGIGCYHGSKTLVWSIKAPQDEITKYAYTDGWQYYGADDAPDGSGVAGFYAGAKLTWPTENFRFTDPSHAFFKTDSQPVWTDATAVAAGALEGVDCDIGQALRKYVSSVAWWKRLDFEDLNAAKAAGVEAITNSLSVIGLCWRVGIYGDDRGIRETDYVIVTKLEGLELFDNEGFRVWPECAHEWEWSLYGEGSAITAACGVAKCRYQALPVGMSIGPSTVAEKYGDTEPLAAELEGADNFAAVTKAAVGDVYYTRGGEKLSAAPREPGEYLACCDIVSADLTVTNTISTPLAILTGQAIWNGVHVADAAEYLEKKTDGDMDIVIGKDFTASRGYVIPESFEYSEVKDSGYTFTDFIRALNLGEYGNLYNRQDLINLLTGKVTLAELLKRLPSASELLVVECGIKQVDLAGFGITAAKDSMFAEVLGVLTINDSSPDGTGSVSTNAENVVEVPLMLNRGTLAINGGTFRGVITNEGALVISGGFFDGQILNAATGSVVLTGGAYTYMPDRDWIMKGYELSYADGVYCVNKHSHRYLIVPLGRSAISCTCTKLFVEDSVNRLELTSCLAREVLVVVGAFDGSESFLPRRNFAYDGEPVEARVIGFNLGALRDLGLADRVKQIVALVKGVISGASDWDDMTALERYAEIKSILEGLQNLKVNVDDFIWDIARIEEETGVKIGEITYVDRDSGETLGSAPSAAGSYSAKVVMTTPKGNELQRTWNYQIERDVEPSVPEDQGEVIVDETTKTVVVEPEEGVRNIDVENGDGYTVEIPPTVDSVTGVEKEDLKIVADATNETETVQVDITSAFNIEQLEGGGLGITLNPEAKVEIVIGETCETNAVMPELGTAAGTTVEKSPFVVGGDTVATGVKTIPGLFYNLLAGEDLAGITNLVKTIEAKSTRVVLEAAKASDPTQFYRVEVTK